MNTAPEVTVVIVAHRARELVLDCLRFLEKDAGLPYEAIVVDDGSNDGTGDAVREAHPEVRVVEKQKGEGLAAGRNTALPLVRGPRVLMLDADTQVTAGALKAMASVLDRDPSVGLVGPSSSFPTAGFSPRVAAGPRSCCPCPAAGRSCAWCLNPLPTGAT